MNFVIIIENFSFQEIIAQTQQHLLLALTLSAWRTGYNFPNTGKEIHVGDRSEPAHMGQKFRPAHSSLIVILVQSLPELFYFTHQGFVRYNKL